MGRSRILVVCSNPAKCEPLLTMLARRPYCPVLMTDPAQAAAAVDEANVALIVLTGSQEFCQPFFRLFGDLRSRQGAPPLCIVANDSSEAFAISSLRAGAAEYLTEPLEPENFLKTISRWIPEYAMEPAEAELVGGEVLVGSSSVMQMLRAQIRRVASTNCNVLITGETGTGKELVARLIHQNSARSKHAMICINCAAIPDTLLESELFGYERGSFTGANCASEGKLMAANRGTVFFDEVGDMSPLAQAKVLRAIETKEIQRLGATRKCDTDIRIVAATHHDLDSLSAPETFRRDLYFRLNVGRIYLPPLRERKADIAELVKGMIPELNSKFGRKIEGVTSAAIRSLAHYDWPGNVRELKNAIERVFISRDEGRISEEDLVCVLPQYPSQDQSAPDEEVLCLREALVTCNGNKSKAAERLNWSRMTLYRKLAKYGLAEEMRIGSTPSHR
jgi:DNA-binding NtrC family response regulator